MPAAVAAPRPARVCRSTGRPFAGIRYLAPGRRWPRRSAPVPASGSAAPPCTPPSPRGPSRSGSTGCAAACGAVEQDGDGVTAAGLRAGWLVAADGLHSPVRRSLGLQVAPAPGGRPATACAGTSWSRPGRGTSRCTGASTPRPTSPRSATDLVGVAVLAAGAGRRTTRRWPASRPCWPGCAGPSRPPPCSGPARCGRSARSPLSGRVLLVGDAAGLRGRADRRGRGGRAGHGARGGGGGRCRAPAGLPVGLAAGDPALPVVGDRPAGRAARPVLRRGLVPLASAAPAVFGRAIDQVT